MSEQRTSEDRVTAALTVIEDYIGRDWGDILEAGRVLASEVRKLNAKLDRLDRDVERWQRQAYNQGARDGYVDRSREERERG
jgi:hypothetical protein